ncbi:MAG: DUF1499 domain-containing protein [Nitrospirae bacterium]|nr:DUF1499 domain-containing protein [Candidatus Manganitrophaceae bacterium]
MSSTIFSIPKSFLFLVLVLTFMGFSGCRGLTHNRAETRANHDDPSLRTRNYSVSYEVFFARLLDVSGALPRWQVLSHDSTTGKIVATRTSRLFRFVDDIQIQLIKKGDQAVSLDLHSASRVGKGDFGQNARNIRELLDQLDQKILN